MNITWNGICGEGLSFSYNVPIIVLSCIVLAIGIWYLICDQKKTETKLAVLGMMIAGVGIYGAKDLFTTYVCFEIAGFLSWFCLVDQQDGWEVGVGKNYLGWLVITGMIMAMGMFFVSYYANTLNYANLSSGYIMQGRWMYVAAGCYIVGYGCRCAIAFLHPWLDTVYENVSVSCGYFIAGVLLPEGFWGLYQLSFSLFYDYDQWEQVLILFGGLTVVLALLKSIIDVKEKLIPGYIFMAEMGWLILISVITEKNIVITELILYYILGIMLLTAVRQKSRKLLMFSVLPVVAQMLLASWSCQRLWILVIGMGILGILLQLGRIVSGNKGWISRLDMKWCSLERLVYIPVVCKAFPFLFGVIFRVLDQLPDGMIALLRRTVYQDSKQRVWDKIGTPFTYILGVVFDEIAHMLNKTLLRKHPIRKSFVNGIAVARKEGAMTIHIVIRSLSFGLMLFCIGLCITLIYLMY